MSVKTAFEQNNNKRLRHIVVDEGNYETLRNLGRTRDSFNDVITRILKGEVDLTRLKIQ